MDNPLTIDPGLSAENSQRIKPPRRRWLARVLLPLGLLLATVLLLVYAMRDSLWPAVPVRMVEVVAKDAPAAAEGPVSAAPTISTQAPGWVEPDPFPIYVSALAGGVVEEVLVLEGESVRKGQTVARLIADDARLKVVQTESELARQKALLAAAKVALENPVALDRAVAVSRALLTESKAQQTQQQSTIAAEEAALTGLQSAYERLDGLSAEAVAPLAVEEAESAFKAQRARVAVARSRLAVIKATIARHEAEVTAAETSQRLKIDERRAVAEKEAQVRNAEAVLAEAQLRLSRMQVIAPSDGVVMRRLAVPGAKAMLDMGDPFSAHIVHLYDPRRLQVRVDVPLADAARVGLGQAAMIEVDALPETEFRGRVSRLVHEADIGKNTVQVKVAIHEPVPMLKPDMLARVKFFTKGNGDGPAVGGAGLQLLIPESTIVRDSGKTSVWLIDAHRSFVTRRDVTLGAARADGWVTVTQGLNPGDALVADPQVPLTEGRRIRVTPGKE